MSLLSRFKPVVMLSSIHVLWTVLWSSSWWLMIFSVSLGSRQLGYIIVCRILEWVHSCCASFQEKSSHQLWRITSHLLCSHTGWKNSICVLQLYSLITALFASLKFGLCWCLCWFVENIIRSLKSTAEADEPFWFEALSVSGIIDHKFAISFLVCIGDSEHLKWGEVDAPRCLIPSELIINLPFHSLYWCFWTSSVETWDGSCFSFGFLPYLNSNRIH